jgi:hypothetical protein
VGHVLKVPSNIKFSGQDWTRAEGGGKRFMFRTVGHVLKVLGTLRLHGQGATCAQGAVQTHVHMFSGQNWTRAQGGGRRIMFRP